MLIESRNLWLCPNLITGVLKPKTDIISLQTSPTSSDGESNEINYYICLVHHGK